LPARAEDLEDDRLDVEEPAADAKLTLKSLADTAVCCANGSGSDVVLGGQGQG
jgi:hypothetical protein